MSPPYMCKLPFPLLNLRFLLPLQKSEIEYQRTHGELIMEMSEFQKKHGKKMRLSLLMPVFGVTNAIIFISQFNAVRGLAIEQVGHQSACLSAKQAVERPATSTH